MSPSKPFVVESSTRVPSGAIRVITRSASNVCRRERLTVTLVTCCVGGSPPTAMRDRVMSSGVPVPPEPTGGMRRFTWFGGAWSVNVAPGVMVTPATRIRSRMTGAMA